VVGSGGFFLKPDSCRHIAAFGRPAYQIKRNNLAPAPDLIATGLNAESEMSRF
jgi:hypothetical protein